MVDQPNRLQTMTIKCAAIAINFNCTKKACDWIEIADRIPHVYAGKFRVRLKNGKELHAYFYEDAMGWIAFYGQKTSHWWSAHGNNERLDGVTHWRERARD